MPTNLFSIGRSGAAAARAAIELSAQNISNAANPDYTRRTLQVGEFVGKATIDFQNTSSLAGVRVEGIQRPGNDLIQRAARDSGSDLARADAELNGLRDGEVALERSRLYDGLVNFEAALTLLESDPTDPALRTGAIESARQLSENFHFADAALRDASRLVENGVSAGIEKINGAASDLARINQELISARDGTAGKAALLDARDAALRDISEEFGIVAQFDEKGVAEVRLSGTPVPSGGAGLLLVSGVDSNSLSATIPGDGTVDFNLAGAAFSPTNGAMAGRVSALSDLASRRTELDRIASETVDRANTAQAAGAALDGSPGQPLFNGASASTIALALNDGADLALAPAGSAPGSRDTANLGNLIASIGADDGPINATDRLLLSLSSRVSGLDTTREGLAIIKESTEAELLAETGVDLDAEAAALIRLQQSFEANSRVIQVASELFDTLLGLR